MKPRSGTSRQGPVVLGISMLLLLAASGACGGDDPTAKDDKTSSSSTKADADFLSSADAACAPYADYQTATPLEVPHFNRYAPDPEVLPPVAAFLEKNPAFKTMVSDLEALGEPKSGAAAWHAALDDFRENARIVGLEIDAAKAGDAAQFGDLVGQYEDNKGQLNTDLKTVGLSGTTCSAAEVDPLRAPNDSE